MIGLAAWANADPVPVVSRTAATRPKRMAFPRSADLRRQKMLVVRLVTAYRKGLSARTGNLPT